MNGTYFKRSIFITKLTPEFDAKYCACFIVKLYLFILDKSFIIQFLELFDIFVLFLKPYNVNNSPKFNMQKHKLIISYRNVVRYHKQASINQRRSCYFLYTMKHNIHLLHNILRYLFSRFKDIIFATANSIIFQAMYDVIYKTQSFTLMTIRLFQCINFC